MGQPPTVEPVPSCSFLTAADTYDFCIWLEVTPLHSETSVFFSFLHPNVIVEARCQELMVSPPSARRTATLRPLCRSDPRVKTLHVSCSETGASLPAHAAPTADIFNIPRSDLGAAFRSHVHIFVFSVFLCRNCEHNMSKWWRKPQQSASRHPKKPTHK